MFYLHKINKYINFYSSFDSLSKQKIKLIDSLNN